ncbi:hypothetical protein MC378_12685 [Polaribacter sp. MSW13]|uniref:Uncharacterized protein n=1 Tax=Polaribacter marinus TaxID=2916838 RepID=A0A9X1VPI3_9FLAO|nr:hypothetical protein [Polaribacter marinus]MCI2230027.1 hypothetical protein [Polaribacter marinus]
MNLSFGNIIAGKNNIWNSLIPSILTFGVLIIYTKEIIIGYKPKSKSWNLKSLLFFLILVITLSVTQISEFDILFEHFESDYWQIILSLIIILSSYLGILINRILKIKNLNNKKTAHNTV